MIPVRNYKAAGHFSIITTGIILLNMYVFWQEVLAEDLEQFVFNWALVPALLDINRPETIITFITSQFMHASLAHIFFNMLFLYIFGRNIEDRFGPLRFLLFYLLVGVIAALIQLFFIADPSIPMLGASGAVAGVLGAYWVLFPRHPIGIILPPFLLLISVPASIVLFVWFLTQILNGVALVTQDVDMGGVAWGAHIGGFVFGALLAALLYKKRKDS